MRRTRVVLFLPVLAVLVIAGPALADHCGAGATVRPSSGPPGTAFVFTTNLGAPSDLHLYRDGTLVRSVFLDGSDVVTHAIRTHAGDAGAWRARAEVRGRPECAAETTFAVLGAPDTSTEPVPARAGPRWLVAALAGGIAFLLAFVWSPASRRM